MEKSHDDEFTGSSQDSNELPLGRGLAQWPKPVHQSNLASAIDGALRRRLGIAPEVTLVIVDPQLYDQLHEIITRDDDHKIQPAEDATSVD